MNKDNSVSLNTTIKYPLNTSSNARDSKLRDVTHSKYPPRRSNIKDLIADSQTNRTLFIPLCFHSCCNPK